MRTPLAILAAVALCGCETTKQFTYPNGYKDFFSASRKSAVAAIASVDGHLTAPEGVIDHEMRHLLWPQGR